MTEEQVDDGVPGPGEAVVKVIVRDTGRSGFTGMRVFVLETLDGYILIHCMYEDELIRYGLPVPNPPFTHVIDSLRRFWWSDERGWHTEGSNTIHSFSELAANFGPVKRVDVSEDEIHG